MTLPISLVRQRLVYTHLVIVGRIKMPKTSAFSILIVLSVIVICETGCSRQPSSELTATIPERQDPAPENTQDFNEELTTIPVASVTNEPISPSQESTDASIDMSYHEEQIEETDSEGNVYARFGVRVYDDGHQVKQGRYEEFYRSGSTFAIGQFLDGHRHGVWQFFHDNGQLARETEYHAGLPTGLWKVFRPDGSLERTTEYRDGVKNGTQTVYWEDGTTIKSQDDYVNNERHGESKRFAANGTMIQRMTFRNGRPNGLEQRWYENGQLAAEGNYTDGLPDGTFVYFDEDGNETMKVNWSQGRRTSTIAPADSN